MFKSRCSGRAFSLVELIIVMVIIAVVAAIAIPRVSTIVDYAPEEALRADLATLRRAVDYYAAEHGNRMPDKDKVADQLTKYTDFDGHVSAVKTNTHIYGPYLNKLPALVVGQNKGSKGIADADGANVGWIYNEITGRIKSNTLPTETTDDGTKFSDL